MKVLLVSPYSSKKIGGIGTWSKSVLNAFADNEEIEIVFQNTAFFLKHNAKKKQTSIRRLIIGAFDTMSILSKLLFNCLFERPSIIHYTSSASWALHKDKIAIKISNVFKIPFVIHWHFGRIPDIFEEQGNEYSLFTKISKQVNASIAIDKKSYDVLAKAGFNNIYYVPNALPENVLRASSEICVEKRDEGTVLFVGQVLKTKGVYELVRSCVKLPAVKRLLIAGPYSEEIYTELMAIASERGQVDWVCFLGEISREDVFKYYSSSTLFALPSYTEGFPYVILEAMAFGCPIIATDVGAIPQLITEETGVLIPSKDVNKLSSALNNLLSEPQKALKLGEKAKQEVIENYSTATVMNQYAKIWKRYMR